MNRSTAQILSVQYLRALAVVGVVAYHASQWAGVTLEVGAAGVDLFFVISGFILWTVTTGRSTSPFEFLRRRAARVAPLYWLATLTALAIVTAFPRAISHIEGEPTHVLLSLLMLPHKDPAGGPFPVLDVGWTLTYEAFFYLVFAAGLLLEETARAIGVTFALIVTVMIGISVPPLYYFGANLFLLEFAAGLWLARAWTAGAMPNAALSILLIALGVGVLTAQQLHGYQPDLWRPVLWGVPALLIALGALGLERSGRLPRWSWLQRLGDASYSIYLAHTIVAPVIPLTIGLEPLWLAIPAIAVVGVGGGLLIHRFVERPLLRLFRAGPRDRALTSS